MRRASIVNMKKQAYYALYIAGRKEMRAGSAAKRKAMYNKEKRDGKHGISHRKNVNIKISRNGNYQKLYTFSTEFSTM